MKSFYTYRSRLEDEALDFLRNGLYAAKQESCPTYLRALIAACNKENCWEIYEEDRKLFKALYNAGNENYRIALWNMLTQYYTEDTRFCRKDFSREEFTFIKAAVKAANNPIDEANINAPIQTDRIILRAIEKSDFKLFAYHYKHDGDFVMFTGYKPTCKMIKKYAKRRSPALFSIEEKNTHRVIGYVGLSIREESATGLLEYYVFKEYRKRGYCKEAIRALVDKALTNKLYEPVETIRECVYTKKAIKLNAVRARISTVNTASIKTVESCGFIHEATIHKTMYKKDFGWTDEEVYYLPMENVK